MLFQGWADAPSQGAYKSHEVLPVFKQAAADTLFLPLCIRKSISSGEEVTIPAAGLLDEPSNSELQEDLSIPLDKLTITAKTIPMKERGRGVVVTKKALTRSPIELLEIHRDRIAKQMAFDMDSVAAAAFKEGKLKYAATGAASYVLATNGACVTNATSNPNFWHIRKMRDLAYQTYHMPKRSNGKYSFVCSTAAKRGILMDPEFLEINKFSGEGRFAQSRVGVIEDVEIIEGNHALDDAMGTGNDVGEGIFIADEAVFYAVLMMPEIHYDATEDFGRFVKLAWYGDYGFGTSTDSANAGFARLIHFTSQS
jgi:hypothetical protein